MARRQQQSSLDDVLTIGTMLPWPLSIVLAIAAFLGLHWYAGSPLPEADGSQLTTGAASLVWVMTRAAANLAQYVVPGLLLVGAAKALFSRKKQRQNFLKVASDPSAYALEKMSWREFEGLVAETFRQKGYRVELRGGAGADGGIDVELFMGRDRYLVQCKQWKTRQVGVAIVRELYGVMAAEGAVGGFVVASGSFTADAAEFAQGKSIELVDARKLRQLIGGYQNTLPVETVPTVTSPACPTCGGHMIERSVNKGPNAGHRFWGCASYPRCKGVRN